MADEKSTLLWFNLSKQDDISIVFDFLERLLLNLEDFLLQPSFLQLINVIDATGSPLSNETLFWGAFEEVKDVYNPNISLLRNRFEQDSERLHFLRQLQQIGFTRRSLRLKANLLNRAWERIEKLGGKIIDFSKKRVVKQVISFLKILNSILGSLAKELPFVEIVKEWKECGEAYLDIAELEGE